MGCRCNERGQQIWTAAQALLSGDAQTAGSNLAQAGRTFGEDAAAGVRAAGQRLAAAHARLKR